MKTIKNWEIFNEKNVNELNESTDLNFKNKYEIK